MEHAYAQALWTSIQKGMDPKTAVVRLMEVLKTRGREALVPKIAHSFGRIAKKELDRTRVVATVATEKDVRGMHTAVGHTLKELGLTEKEVETNVDETLIGGWRVEGRGHLVDASYKKYLLDIFNRATAGM